MCGQQPRYSGQRSTTCHVHHIYLAGVLVLTRLHPITAVYCTLAFAQTIERIVLVVALSSTVIPPGSLSVTLVHVLLVAEITACTTRRETKAR
jgi:hypothetical protein